jgi:chemotaxis protein methyltransferase CheR
MSDAQFEYFRNLAKSQAGINIPNFKKNMVYRRICKRLVALEIGDFDTYISLLMSAAGSGEYQNFVNALTTNKTSFFREPHHFEHLAATAKTGFRNTITQGSKKILRIWSAGCSLGAEPYSIAMRLKESINELGSWDVRILATDIDTEMVKQAATGVYNGVEMEDVSLLRKQRHFSQLDDDHWGVSDALRKMIVFNHLNLHGVWPMQRKFDAIFCRNVIIYFDKQSQCVLFDRFANLMRDGGFLYIGHSESLFKVTERFVPVGQCIYQKVA